MVALEQIAELDRIASRSWPAREVQRLGGWLLRATNGVTRRANSVLPLDSDGIPIISEAIEQVCEFYTKRSIVPRFQMTRACQPEDLDRILGEHGFEVELKVIIQTSPIAELAGELAFPVDVKSIPNLEWLAAYAKAGGYDESTLSIRQEIMGSVPAKKGYAAAKLDGKIVGIGFGVVDRGWIGLFAIVTQPEYRRRRVATTVSRALALWGQRQGATRVYLQVEERNDAALKLYEGLGFRNHHRYWYRMLPTSEEKG